MGGVPAETEGMLPPGQAHFYPIFIHAKCYVVDGSSGQTGSANLNDRSFLGTMKSDAELNIAFFGDAAAKLVSQDLERYTGSTSPLFDTSASTWAEMSMTKGLAAELNKIAEANNKHLSEWLRLD